MKQFVIAVCGIFCALCGYSQSLSGDSILAFVRERLPDDPLTLSGELKIRAPNGFTKASLPVRMDLNWGAQPPRAEYHIGDEGLTIIWEKGIPKYTFTEKDNTPTSEIMDTGLTWADLSFSVLWWPNAELVDETRKINRACYVVEVPVPDSEWTMRLWIEKEMGMLLEAQTIDTKGREIRSMEIRSIKKMDGMWVAKDLDIRNRQNGTRTTLEIDNLEWEEPKKPADEPAAVAFDPAESVNRLAVDLYRQLADGSEDNLFISPYSISSALAMVYAGARGETAGQMNRTLHFGGPGATHPAFDVLRKILNDIRDKGQVALQTANRLWPQEGLALNPDYTTLTREFYGSDLVPVDYRTAAETARQQINTWVEEQTQGRIEDLIDEGVLTDMTRLVLADAIYFKGHWASQFNKEHTRAAPFTKADGTTVDVPMMSQTGDYPLARTNNFQALELPYEGDDLAMLILLPDAAGGLPEVEAALSAELLNKLSFLEQEVAVSLPRFKLESKFQLGKTLSKLGMPLAFSREADFSGITEAEQLYIDAVIHQAFVEVNEEGTEAAAATAVGMRTLSMPPQFRADHPFLFLIRENSTGTILFIGRVMEPTT